MAWTRNEMTCNLGRSPSNREAMQHLVHFENNSFVLLAKKKILGETTVSTSASLVIGDLPLG